MKDDKVNIRSNKKTEVNQLVKIWYEGSLIAHDFIDKNYWKSQQTEMEEKYIPMSETYVVSNEKDIVGFVSMMDNYLAALFIDVTHQGGGYGKGLLDFIKSQRENIQLKVYKKNKKAVDFYLKNSFVIKEETRDEQTSEKEFLMEWEKG
ncbi:MAG TPA: GNAT family N-acetyltransferase [Pseudogracilibacillus sp.]|nr:GNAT family N-acetyltransferase [Pseudogracilibacillus sp.]